ncbi:acetyltransferase (GNAT) family protein [Thermosporothrix hazakensis]|uniref:Acetyltransferase (GNAT) family protein n=1 Tax=Thermosporothrix hazakensis TaxID=644383 RepID=A0A326UBU2_THEHA|nr:GNAT family N-acetyltransferase [Thermosporothrix hazakensis]PZW22526.1 acetyltransferase (GNAT) family protein [Thermosporothrix hazakensis]GCE50215.1 hypothetical protein KTH_50840 [Thermosporothrix hazakensis]
MHSVLDPAFRRDLGDGLVLRWSTADDIERIATLHSLVHRDAVDAPPNEEYIRQIRRMMSDDFPLMGPRDFGVVEDTSKAGNPIIATTAVWRHTWAYEGIPFHVGRPEMVATDPAYRNRGLIRALFELFHARSEAQGDLVQAITGISYFYRQFGYEYALELDDRRMMPIALIPEVRGALTLREATVDDIPLLEELYRRRQASGILSELPTRAMWLYDIETWKRHPELRHFLACYMLVNAAGETVGALITDAYRRGKALYVWLLELIEGTNMQAILPSLLQALRAYGAGIEPALPDGEPFLEICFALGTTHPVFEFADITLRQPVEAPYAWYLRVKDLPGFLLHIAPALEQRLAASSLAGYSGDIKVNFYRGGLRMHLERGRLKVVEDWRKPVYGESEDASFPPLLFLQVLFGYRSVDFLRQVFPDVWASVEAAPLLKVLFPTRPSFMLCWN